MQRFLVVLLGLSLFLSNSLFAQKGKGEEYYDGWLAFKNGDTLRGKICYENTRTGELYMPPDKKILFVDTNGTKRKFGPEKLVSLYCNNKHFEYISLDPNRPPFMMQRVIKGDASMYKTWFLDNKSNSQKYEYEEVVFIKKKDETLFTEVTAKGFKKTMRDFFSGDTQVLDKIKANNWGFSDLEKIINTYNDLE